jgi:hypothetical protein
MSLFKEGLARWKDLLKKKRKEIMILKLKNEKRTTSRNGARHA